MPHRVPRRVHRGRPTKLTPQVAEKIIAAVRAGNYLETAAENAGVNRTTLYRWQQAGSDADADPELRDFCNALTRARAEAEARMVGCVLRDAMGGTVVKRITRTYRNGVVETEEQVTPPNHRAAIEFLSRSFPQTWGRRAVEVTGADGGPVQVEQRSVIIGVLADRLHATFAGELEAPGAPGDGADT